MKKKISCIMTCVVLIGMLLVGCGGKDGKATVITDGATIYFEKE